MPRKNESKGRRRGFGIFLGALRASREESQEELAAKLYVTRTVISNIENGSRLPSAGVLSQLRKVFPQHEQALIDEVERHQKLLPDSSRRAWVATQRAIDGEIATGHFHEALDVIRAQDQLDTPFQQRLWLRKRHERIAMILGETSELALSLMTTLEYSEVQRLPRSQVISLHDRYASARAWNGQAVWAHGVLNKGLAQFPDSAQLWYRKGSIEWGEGKLDKAEAFLTTALKYRGRRTDILCLRGMIRTEMHVFMGALKDFADALGGLEKPAESACAYSARVWAAHYVGEISHEEAMAEFAQLEPSMPENAWLYYYRGCCNLRAGNEGVAFDEWENRALVCDRPSVCDWTKGHIEYSLGKPAFRASFGQYVARRQASTVAQNAKRCKYWSYGMFR